MAEGANEETVRFKVELDPQGFRSQLVQLKQEIGLTLGAAAGSFGQTLGAGAVGFNSMARDVGNLASMFSSPGGGPKESASLLAGVAPEISALMGGKPSYYGIEEWGALNRENMMKSSADFAHRMSLSAVPALMGDIGGGVGAGMGSAVAARFMGAGLASTLVGGFAGGIPGYMLAAGVGEVMMEPAVTRYAARSAIDQAGGRYGISPSTEILAGVDQIGRANNMSGTETLSVLRAGLATGAIGQVSGADDFRAKFSQLMEGAREVSRTMQTELAQSVQLISSLQESGFGGTQGAVNAIRNASAAGRLTGSSTQEMLSLSQSGAAMAVGQGMTADAGQRAVLSAFEGITAGMRNKAIDTDAVHRLGGRANAAAEMAANHFKFLGSSVGQATMLARFDPSTGQLDNSRAVFEPGMAFRQAADNLYSGGNPMRNLVEFQANMPDLASGMDPTESALHQVMGGVRVARHLGGPLSKDFIISTMAATQNMSRSAAEATYGMLDPSVQNARLQSMRDQQVAAAERGANYGGFRIFEGRGTWSAGIQAGAERFSEWSGLNNFVGGLGNMGRNVMSWVDAKVAGVRRFGLGSSAPRPMLPQSVMDTAFSSPVGLRVSAGSLALDSENIEKYDRMLVEAINAIDTGADDTTRALFEGSLGEIVAARTTKDPAERSKIIDALNKRASDDTESTSQRDIFKEMVRKAVEPGQGAAGANIQAAIQFQARREGTMAGFRFLQSRTAGGAEALGAIAGTGDATTRLGLATTLTNLLEKGNRVQGDSLDAMRSDHRSILEKMGKGDSIAVSQLENDKHQAFVYEDLKKAAGDDGALSKDELQNLETKTLERFAATRAKLAGNVMGGPGGGSQIEMITRLIRVMDQTNHVLGQIQKLPALQK